MSLYAEYRDLGRMSYADALDVQRSRFDQLLAGDTHPDAECAGTVFTVEHPAVYTLGKNGHPGNLLVDEEFLRSTGAQFFRTDRGGDITFHGEGQIVGYPVLNLARIGIGLREYVDVLEQAVIDTVAEYGIAAGRSAGASGVWLGRGAEGVVDSGMNVSQRGLLRKICAIGVRASRYITMHGFALNVTTDLGRFAIINPCGFTDRGVTSMERELGYAPNIDEVKNKVITHLAGGLNIELRRV